MGYSEEEALEKSKYKRRVSNTRCIEYWIERGYTENDAIQKIKEIQSNSAKKQKGIKKSPGHIEKMKKFQSYYSTIDYWVDKYGDAIGKVKYDEYKNKISKRSKMGIQARIEKDPDTFINSSVRRKEYWIRQGYSEQEAEMMVSKVQSRGVDFYIKKYGKEKGLIKWEERNKKWFNTFYNSGKNFNKINEKRKLNSHIGYYTKDTIKGVEKLNFYIIILKDLNDKLFVKYGLTKHNTISKRWSISLKYNLFLFKSMSSLDAIELENKFHEFFKNSYTPNIIKTTECFDYNNENLNKTLEILEDYKND